MVGWHHHLNGYEFEQTLGDGKGQGNLECCSPWDHKESDTGDEQQQNRPYIGDANLAKLLKFNMSPFLHP